MYNDITGLELCLTNTDWIIQKAKQSEQYSQNIYSALCNTVWIRDDTQDTQKGWMCSWRYAGSIVAHMVQKGDYLDWYCSGSFSRMGYVPEGYVTDEIREDFRKLGWIELESNNET